MRRRRFIALGAGLLVAASGCLPRDEREGAGVADVADSGHGATSTAPGEGRRPAPSPAERPRRADGDSSAREEPDDGADGREPPDDALDDADEAAPAEIDPDDYPSIAEEWGEQVTGVRSTLSTEDPVVALTLDACGGAGGSGYDEALIDLLIAEAIPATLFVNERWIEANRRTFLWLAEQPLFEIANHGSRHVPLSVEGRSAYGIAGTASPREVIEEVTSNQDLIERLTGERPAHFRPGTAYCDEVAVRIVGDLGLDVVGFDIAADAGATFTSEQVTEALSAARPGSIALAHMNHPGSGTFRGVEAAIPSLRDRGLSFTTVDGRRATGAG